ncbi:hypothetical protein V1511DRAFT_499023 [Dipodascopsis uninucleata]
MLSSQYELLQQLATPLLDQRKNVTVESPFYSTMNSMALQIDSIKHDVESLKRKRSAFDDYKGIINVHTGVPETARRVTATSSSESDIASSTSFSDNEALLHVPDEAYSPSTGLYSSNIQNTEASVNSLLPEQHKYKNPFQESKVEIMLNGSYILPPHRLMASLIKTYCRVGNPWIPILHATFEPEYLKHRLPRSKDIILYAITSVTLKHSDESDILPKGDLKAKWSAGCRQHVVMKARSGQLEVETLQALIIITFDAINSGECESVCEYVRLMVTGLESIDLANEENVNIDTSNEIHGLSHWSIVEGRRRTFWIIFLLERLTKMVLHNCFKDDNEYLEKAIKRCLLPCERMYWANQVPTKSRRLLRYEFLTARANEWCLEYDKSTLGGLAYSVEATEMLSHALNLFIQYNRNEEALEKLIFQISSMDNLLMTWKEKMPEQWRLHPNRTSIMDHNLTLAHISHNTTIMLLHQFVTDNRILLVDSRGKLVDASQEVCIAAVSYLSVMDGPVSAQFVFCLFLIGKLLLTHAVSCGTTLLNEFETIMTSLSDISKRWDAISGGSKSGFAGRFLSALQDSKRRYLNHELKAETTKHIIHSSLDIASSRNFDDRI